jgi:hypothetical protein
MHTQCVKAICKDVCACARVGEVRAHEYTARESKIQVVHVAASARARGGGRSYLHVAHDGLQAILYELLASHAECREDREG